MRTRNRIALMLGFAALWGSVAAYAQQGTGTGPNAAGGRMEQFTAHLQQRFQAADKDGNGDLTRPEAEAGMPYVARQFDQIDTAKRGAVTLPQIEAYLASRAAAKRGM